MEQYEDVTLQYPPASERIDPVEYPRKGNMVEVYVDKVYGSCPSSIEGHKFDFVGFANTRTGMCGIAVANVYPYVEAMSIGVTAMEMGIAKSGEDGYVMCPAWGPPTCEAQVIFRLHPVPVDMQPLDWWYEFLARGGHHCVPSYFRETFLSEEAKERRKKEIQEWIEAGKPKFWEGWRNPPLQRALAENRSEVMKEVGKDVGKK